MRRGGGERENTNNNPSDLQVCVKNGIGSFWMRVVCESIRRALMLPMAPLSLLKGHVHFLPHSE